METVQKNEPGSSVNNKKAEDNAEHDPWYPPIKPYDHSDPTMPSYQEWCRQRNAVLKASKSTNVIIPDRTPEDVTHALYTQTMPDLWAILEEDDVRRSYLNLYARHSSNIAWGLIVIPEALNRIIIQDATRCAKVVLEGKAPELEVDGVRANPNCMNKLGYFPLHEAAERFSVDMIKLLLRHGARTDLPTAGAHVIEDLLPLHVAVVDTCLHKYFRDNLSSKVDAEYVYTAVHLLCLPEFKIFLDATRLLAKHTDNLVEDI